MNSILLRAVRATIQGGRPFANPPFAVTSLVLLAAFVASVVAAPDGRVVQSGSGTQTVSLAGIRTDGTPESKLFLQVLRADLDRSGWLKVQDAAGSLRHVDGTVRGGTVPVASLQIVGPGVATPWSRQTSATEIRQAAHEASDEIVLRLTGNPGMAAAPILLVGKRGGRTDIYCCDADGARMRALTSEGKTCLSPSWLPDRSGFLYTAFIDRYAAVYQAKILPGNRLQRTVVANYPGLNTGGAVSPDGRFAALVLSLTGNVELYLRELGTKRLIRLTKTPHANEASPAWAPNGKTLAYVSDETGRPQVYLLKSTGGPVRRLVSGLAESVAPDWSADGTKIAFCGRSPSGYAIYITDLNGNYVKISPDGDSYQDPSWAPDNRHVVASRGTDGRRTLVLLDSKGAQPVNLTPYAGDWYLPDWAR